MMWGPQPFVVTDPAVATVAHEYRRIGLVRRLVLRWVSPDLARAARHMAVSMPQGERFERPKPGPASRAVERYFAGSSR